MKLLNLLLLLCLAMGYSCSKSAEEGDGDDIESVEADGEELDEEDVELADGDEEDDELDEDEGFEDDEEYADDDDEDEEGDEDEEEFADDSLEGGDDSEVALDEGGDLGQEALSAGADGMDAVETQNPVDMSDSALPPADAAAGYAGAGVGAGGAADGVYTVRANETLMLIAFNLYGDYNRWREIQSLNQDVLGGGTNVSAGMQLKYNTQGAGFTWSQPGDPYLIERGDTLGKISAKRYGTTSKWRQIWENNRPLIKDPNMIFAGFTIFIPVDDGRGVASMPEGGAPMDNMAAPVQDQAPLDQAMDTVDGGFEEEL